MNGILVDLRDMRRQVQEIAYAEGMIPYIPGLALIVPATLLARANEVIE
jgi:hypothetical protein